MTRSDYAPRPRIGDEVVFNRGVVGKERRLVIVDVKSSKQVVTGAKNPEERVANLRASMGEEWRETYWMALMRSGNGVIWMDVLEVAKYGGEVESFHKEL
jgi:hypothetical protein